MSTNLESETSFDKANPTDVGILPTFEDEPALGHIPASRKNKLKSVLKSLVTKDGWLGDYVSKILLIAKVTLYADVAKWYRIMEPSWSLTFPTSLRSKTRNCHSTVLTRGFPTFSYSS